MSTKDLDGKTVAHTRGQSDEENSAEREGVPAPSETHWSQASGDGLQRPAPQQFSELDESASSQVAASASMEAVGKLAYHDTLNAVDTDRGPVLDAVYNGPVTEGRRVADDEDAHATRRTRKLDPSSKP